MKIRDGSPGFSLDNFRRASRRISTASVSFAAMGFSLFIRLLRLVNGISYPCSTSDQISRRFRIAFILFRFVLHRLPYNPFAVQFFVTEARKNSQRLVLAISE